MFLFALAILAGLTLLAVAADKFVDGSSGLANSLGVSKLVIGLIVVGFGTSAPELLVSTMSALGGSPGISIGNALGSNISNIALVIGVTAIILPLPVASGIVRREFPFLGLATITSLVLLWDGTLSRFDGFVMIGLLFYTLARLLKLSSRASPVDPAVEEAEESLEDVPSVKLAWKWTLIGLAGMLIGSKMLVWGAESMAIELGVPPLVAGLTIVAVGTSAPELAASIVSARRGETDLVIGNVIGSNLFNTLAVLGIPGLLAPCDVPSGVLSRDYPIMIVLTILFFLASMTPRGRGIIGRREGLFFAAAFVGYQLLLIFTGNSPAP